jgi:hypothetical protein
MANVLFISDSYLKQNSFVGENVQANVLTSAITTAQTIKIQSILGKALYDKLCNDIANAGGSLTGVTGNYAILLEEYVIPALTNWALYESIVPLTLKFTNKGISRAQDQYTEGIDLETMKYIRNDVRNEAEWYSQRLTTYLCNNTTLFPEYSDYTARDLYPSVKAGGYESGIYFKKRRSVTNNFYPDKDDYTMFTYDGNR